MAPADDVDAGTAVLEGPKIGAVALGWMCWRPVKLFSVIAVRALPVN